MATVNVLECNSAMNTINIIIMGPDYVRFALVQAEFTMRVCLV
jgi:hypothetical protein